MSRSNIRYIGPILAVAVLLAAAGLWFSRDRPSREAIAETKPVLLAGPLGVTFQELRLPVKDAFHREGSGVKIVLANAAGMTAYVNDKESARERAACDSHCAEMWHPLIATGDPSGVVAAWSVYSRPDGTRQWAYKGKPLYIYANDSKVGEANGEGVDGTWHAAYLGAVSDITTPFGIGVAGLANAAGEVLVDSRGLPLYWPSGSDRNHVRCMPNECPDWIPLGAGALDHPIGDFSPVTYDAGIRQWSYQGRPLYLYTGDKEIGDVGGMGVSPGMRIAMLAAYYMPPGIVVRRNLFGGVNLATVDGTTLYFRNRAMPPQGHSLRTGTRGDPRTGQALGIRSCEGECTEQWHPLPAPDGAVAAGYWGVVTRDNGMRQWSYRGFPLYTYAEDHAPGEMSGNDIFDFDPPDAPIDVGVPSPGSGLGFLSWHVAVP